VLQYHTITENIMSQFLELLKKRISSRAISAQEISSEIIDELMQAGQLTASCFNNQPWRFLFLTNDDALNKGRKALASGNEWAESAPLLIIGFSKPDLDCQLKDGRNYYQFDLGMAVQSIMMQATDYNLAARPMAGFSQSILKTEFKIPDEYEIYVMVAVGYEDESNGRAKIERKRKPLSENFYTNKVDFLN